METILAAITINVGLIDDKLFVALIIMALVASVLSGPRFYYEPDKLFPSCTLEITFKYLRIKIQKPLLEHCNNAKNKKQGNCPSK